MAPDAGACGRQGEELRRERVMINERGTSFGFTI